LSLFFPTQNLKNIAGILYDEADILAVLDICVFNNICDYLSFSFKYS